MEPIAALNRIALRLEEQGGPRYRAMAFRRAAAALAALPAGEIDALVAAGRLRSLSGIGDVTATVIEEALAGAVPAYLQKLEGEDRDPAGDAGGELRAALKGDCHTHSDWSDGRVPIPQMAAAAQAMGHQYMVLTDHSPRLKIARGLSPERLREQLTVVERLNEETAPFRILTGIEVDILADGSLDQEEELLARLDMVVASVHSFLRMEHDEMTRRMIAALSNPYVDILGHCTGRMRTARRDRSESEFDAAAVFATAARFDKAIEVNCQPQRRDPPRRLIRQALEAGCRFVIDTDAHAPGELGWQILGCERAADRGVTADRVVNAAGANDLREWAKSHRRARVIGPAG